MSLSATKVEKSSHLLSIVGPLCIILSLILLVVKDTPFDIQLSLVAMSGFFLCTRWKLQGFGSAVSILAAVLTYDFFFQEQQLTVWEAGLSASLVIAFLVTSLANLEIFETFKAIQNGMLSQISVWEEQSANMSQSKSKLEEEINALKEKVKVSTDGLNAKIQEAETYEKLLSIAREELQIQTSMREELQKRFFNERQEIEQLKEKVEQADLKLSSYQSNHQMLLQKEDELKSLRKSLAFAEQELAQKIASVQNAEETIGTLTGQLESLTGKLKGLLSEKEELEKALDEVLKDKASADSNVKDDKTLRRVEGLYLQLRSQFSEKSQTLDETRRELFQVKEQYLQAQLEQKEHFTFDREEIIKSFEGYLIKLAREIEAKEVEIVQLESLLDQYAKTGY